MAHAQPLSPLDNLLARAEQIAGLAMREFGRVPYALLVQCPTGRLVFMPEDTGDGRAKGNFATTAQLICIGHDASAAVVILPGRMKVAAPGKTLDPKRPSEALELREVVVLSGEARGSKRQRFLPIIRTSAGGFSGFGESDLPEFNNFQGRFAEILPPHPPTKHMQTEARLVLEAMGVTDDDLMRGEARWS